MRTYRRVKKCLKSGCHPLRGCPARIILCANIRLMTKSRTTPAATKIFAAIATETSCGKQAQTIRMTFAVMRAMQKPKSRPLMMNLCPLFMFTCRMVM